VLHQDANVHDTTSASRMRRHMEEYTYSTPHEGRLDTFG
jgi:hypothetical protein